jgi:hypothetical protein
VSASIVEKLLAGDPEAEKEYRRILTSDLALDGEFVDRLLSRDNVAKVKEARRIGIHPDSILTLCCLYANRTWSGHQLTPTEAKEAVCELREMKRDLRRLLRLSELPMSEPPTRGEISSPLPLTKSTAAQPEVYGKFWLFDPKAMRTLWDVAGRGEEEGLLGGLAKAIEAQIESLTKITPAHRPAHFGQRVFALEWNRLAHYGAKRPCDELGAWFFEVTFGKAISVEAFAKLIQRAKRVSPSKIS